MDPQKYNDLSTDILIIGGGASGLMAAISAARKSRDKKITVLERHSITGRKLLATGNGTCNLSNINALSENIKKYYYGADIGKIRHVLDAFCPEETMRFFMGLGIPCFSLPDGRIYPYCRQAYAVRNALEREAVRLGIRICRKVEVTGITRNKGFFTVRCEPSPVKEHKDRSGTIKSYVDKGSDSLRAKILSSGKVEASAVILSTGGKASPALASDGSGYPLVKSLGHTVTDIFPGIVRLRSNSCLGTGISGIRMDAGITLQDGKRQVYEEGEILFTSEGISGPAALQISLNVEPEKDYGMKMDLLPEYLKEQLEDIFQNFKKTLADVPVAELFDGFFPAALSAALSKHIFKGRVDMKMSALSDKDISRAASAVKSIFFDVIGPDGWEEAQITAGGIPLSEIDEKTMASKMCNGLYLTGEIMDATGKCGGFNLQLAWSGGYIAGRSAAANCP